MHIAVLTGGSSSEREIALKSSQTVVAALRERAEDQVDVFDFPNDIQKFLDARSSVDIAAPVFHGRGGEDGDVQGFLKTLGIQFIFSDVEAHALAMDKPRTKVIVTAAGVTVPQGRMVRRGEVFVFEHPVVIKPPDAGSSVGVSIAHSQEELDAALSKAFLTAEEMLVEDYVAGREFTVPVIEEGTSTIALPVIQIISKNAFFDLESKYDPSLAEELCPAPIEDELAKRLQELAVKAHVAVSVRHVSRSDYIVDSAGKIWFLEINTIPGMTAQSLLPKALSVTGRTFGGVLRGWIDSILQT